MPKGDADGLRADLDGGWAKVSNLLSEALCSAPLSGGELRVVWFIIRRTYGYGRAGRDPQFKADIITAAEIVTGTGMQKGTVRAALLALQKGNVIWSETTVQGGPRLYGVNPEVNEWGEATADWRFFRAGLKEAHEQHTFDRNPHTGKYVHLCRISGKGVRNNQQRATESFAEGGGLSPTGSGPDSRAKESFTEKGTEEAKASRVPARDPALSQGFQPGDDAPSAPAQSDPEPPPPTVADRPDVQAIQAAWEAFPQAGVATGPKFSGLIALVQQHGIPLVEEWAAWLRGHPQALPPGATPWPYFCTRFKTALTQPWSWKGNSSRASPGATAPFTIPQDRSTYLETKL